MNILYETDKLILENEFETIRLKDKVLNEILFEEELYGEAECGLIDKLNRWAIVGGEYIIIWKPNKIKIIQDQNLKWIHSLRLKNDNIVEVLTDPWGSNPAIWEIDLNSFKAIKIKDFLDYKQKEYTPSVIW